jgi:hypothetical protein
MRRLAFEVISQSEVKSAQSRKPIEKREEREDWHWSRLGSSLPGLICLDNLNPLSHRTTPSVRKVTQAEKERKFLVPCSACKLLGPK